MARRSAAVKLASAIAPVIAAKTRHRAPRRRWTGVGKGHLRAAD
jgi:hypothetical protein